jgi:hypothetical protein
MFRLSSRNSNLEDEIEKEFCKLRIKTGEL